MVNNTAFIILAAGRGSRIKSTFSKVLHEIGGKPMILKTIETIQKLKPDQIIAVVGFDAEDVKKALLGNNVEYAHQNEQLGTGDATKVGLKKVIKSAETVVVLNGDDSAFYKPHTLQEVIKTHIKNKGALTFVTLEPKDPTGLGRVVRQNGEVIKVVEEKDATEEEKKIEETNDGLYVFQKLWLKNNIEKIEKSKVTSEYYLLDLIKFAIDQKGKIVTYKLKNPEEWHSINTLEDLSQARQKAKLGVEPLKIHVMGVAGAGAAAIAGIVKELGYDISGCDLEPKSPYTKNLALKILKGHSKSHLDDVNMLVISPAVLKFDPQNEELKAAKEKKIPTITWQEFQGRFLQKDKYVITVAGAYGKSTTTAMIAQILIDAGLDPTCEIGAKVNSWNKNFKVGKSRYYVCESDEYNNNFLNYHPDIAVVLNVAWDHPDFFKNQKEVVNSYQKFINNIKPGGILVIPESHSIASLQHDIRKDIKVIIIKNFGRYNLKIIGNFRKQNADAAVTVAELLKISINSAKKSLANFSGVGRRLEYKGETAGVKFYDDYAVQPFTVLKTSNALKEKFPQQKVTLVFEPHTFSRINTFYKDFVKNLKQSKVDQILITDVFAAREKGDVKKLSKKLTSSIGTKSVYTGSVSQTARYVKENFKNYDIVCSMGAGDSYKLYDLIKK